MSKSVSETIAAWDKGFTARVGGTKEASAPAPAKRAAKKPAPKKGATK